MSALATVPACVGVGLLVLSSLACVLSRGTYVPLHLAGPASVVGLPLVAVGVAAAEGFGLAGVKVLLTAGVVAATAPVLTAATGHARLRAERDGADDGGSEGRDR